MKKFNNIAIFLGTLLIYMILVIFIQKNLPPIYYASHNLFFLDLMGIKLDIHSGLFVFFGAANIGLLRLISKRFFAGLFCVIPPAIYAISPWGSFLAVAGSFYVYLAFLLLLAFYGVVIIWSDRGLLGSVILMGAFIASVYSSFLLSLVLPVILLLIIAFKLTPIIRLKFLLILVVFLVPLLFLFFNNRLALKNILNNEIRIFEDPGLLNMVNNYQGAAQQQGFGKLAKLSENKYLFFSEYTLLKITKQFVPSTFFTPQEKLLNFSFSPPIYFGFLIPFIFGLFQIFKYPKFKKVLAASTLLVIPSVLAKPMVDLNRLFIFMPVVIFLTAFGLIQLYEQRSNKKIAILLTISIFLVVFQLAVIISDIQTREGGRFIRYYGQNFEIGKQ